MKLLVDIDEVESLRDKLKYSVDIKNRKDYILISDCFDEFQSEYGFVEITGNESAPFKFKFSSELDLAYLKLRYPNRFSSLVRNN